MYPHERSLVRHLADKPFAIVGVNSDRDLDGIKTTAAEKHITWRSFWNGPKGTGGPISKTWRVSSWPTTYLIDKDGVIRYKNVRGASLDEAIEVLMKEMGEDVVLAGVDHEAEDEKALAALDGDLSEESSEEPKKADGENPEATDKPEDAAAKANADDAKKEKASTAASAE